MPFKLPPLYPIIDMDLCPHPLESIMPQMADAGIRLVQLRAKNLTPRDFFHQAMRMMELANPLRLQVIVNDHADIALLSGALGVHIGQNDLPVEAARKVLGKEKIIGLSTSSAQQARLAQLSSADYVAVGPIFPTHSKENPDPIVGKEELMEIRRLVRKPLVAIGGITAENASALYELGIDSVSVIQDLMTAPDLRSRVKQYFAATQGHS
jgi:thiamine-phosphate pyrophosphorylase